ncbi:hypothetical protein D3C71_1421590 [compost metagenome]
MPSSTSRQIAAELSVLPSSIMTASSMYLRCSSRTCRRKRPLSFFTTMVRVSLGRFLAGGTVSLELSLSGLSVVGVGITDAGTSSVDELFSVSVASALVSVVSLMKSSTLLKSLSLYKCSAG